MDRSEPALVPQWYKLANGSNSSNTLHISTSKRSDENGMECGSRSRLLSHHDKNFRRSLSSNGSIVRDRGSSAKLQDYSSFRRSRDKNQERDFDTCDRQSRPSLVENGIGYHDPFLRVRAEKDALRHSQSTLAGRQLDSCLKRPVNSGNNIGSVGSVIRSIDRKFEKDFPSLQAEGRQNFSDSIDVLSPCLKTAVQSLPVATAIINGTSALAEIPVQVETDGSLLSSATGNTMAEALAQRPSLIDNGRQSSVDTQRIEELVLKKFKQLVPVTPVLPKVLACNDGRYGEPYLGMARRATLRAQGREFGELEEENPVSGSSEHQIGKLGELTLEKSLGCVDYCNFAYSEGNELFSNNVTWAWQVNLELSRHQSINDVSEKAKTKSAKGGVDFSSFAKGGQQINLAGRTPVRSDIAKAYQVGNFQVLNREKNIISPTAEDSSSVRKASDQLGLVPSTASVASKTQSDQKNKGEDKNGVLKRVVSVGERKLLSHTQNRNDFFNLLRKKSLNPSGSIREPGSHGPPEDLQNASSVSVQNCQPGLDFSAENINLSTDEPDRLYVDNKEANSYLDAVPDPEEEAFLRSLGWDKNAGEEALTQEEIDAFLKKYETQTRRPLKSS
ncbi:hypothetical protein ZIOFF_051469 [Zingiber officinale]|uniref:Uncharacterized protein n=1 Tax=Zingiber officinale TaxID=94328 RepID=A0A8J5FM37_ZINOF|nr:hypothetical protein ZIOFF_051469 [Zingiber officinale]